MAETVSYLYDNSGSLATVMDSGSGVTTTYYYVTNLQGDVIAILDSTGTMVVNYHYDAYGVLLQTGGTMAATLGILNPLTYRGYVYDHGDKGTVLLSPEESPIHRPMQKHTSQHARSNPGVGGSFLPLFFGKAGKTGEILDLFLCPCYNQPK